MGVAYVNDLYKIEGCTIYIFKNGLRKVFNNISFCQNIIHLLKKAL